MVKQAFREEWGGVLAELMPDEPEAHGLLALALLTDARRDARFADGMVVISRDQNRELWDLQQIEEGRAVLDRAVALGRRTTLPGAAAGRARELIRRRPRMRSENLTTADANANPE